jgi:hypothetical protein
MDLAEAFMQGNAVCEVEGCSRIAQIAVKDFGHLFGHGAFASDLVQIGPIHFLCDLHKRDSHSFRKVNGEWARF